MSISVSFLPFTHESPVDVDTPLVRMLKSSSVILLLRMKTGRKWIIGFAVLSRSSTMGLPASRKACQYLVSGILSGVTYVTESNTEAAVGRRMHCPFRGFGPLTLLSSSIR